MKNPYIRMATGLYINYFLLGMINVILSSNMSFLTVQLNTDKAAIGYLVSAIGIGKLLALGVAGKMSDKYGRKPLIVIASFAYLIFLIGIPLAPNYTLAFVFAIIAGLCNSMMDAGTYPALIEGFGKKAGSATVLVKASISIGAIVIPFMIAFFINHDMFYGYSFFIPAGIYLLNGIFLSMTAFPNHKAEEQKAPAEAGQSTDLFHSEPKFWQEGLSLIIIGFTSTVLFMIVQLWLPTFGQDALGMDKASAIKLLSYYSIGSLVSVILLAVVLGRFIKPITVMIVYPLIALLSLLALIVWHNPVATLISSFLIGLSTAGIFQIALTVMTEFFRKNKGTTTSLVNIAASLSFILMPLATGSMSKSLGITSVFILDIAIAVVSILLAVFVAYRYKKVFY
ncbi:MFS transporter [Paenibacillus sp. AK121]|uniref:MFS transporter n=1 Tax=Paenibacillus TaxID=44249 RepID=UPI001C2315CB|nr:MFS transporter [Paenibacillus sp. AK121]MBU9708428.1 MFS transporter [Paenibacillus sp. AK121]